MNKRKIGTDYESVAVDYLEDKGMRVLETNYHYKKVGEIDIIARDNDELVFVEVKYRSSDKYGGADYAVDYKKQNQIKKIAALYMMKRGISEKIFIRFDTVHITGDKINYIKNSFGGM